MQLVQLPLLQVGIPLKIKSYLTEVIQEFQRNGIRTSIFVDPILEIIEGAKKTGTDRIELYTEAFAHQYDLGNKNGIDPYVKVSRIGKRIRFRN